MCRVDAADVNARMVEQGWAVAYPCAWTTHTSCMSAPTAPELCCEQVVLWGSGGDALKKGVQVEQPSYLTGGSHVSD